MKKAISSASHSELSYSSSSPSSSLELSTTTCLFLLFLLSLKAILLLCGSDAFGEVLDVVGFFNIHFIVYDPTKHIIGWHSLLSGVLVDQGNHVVVHGCVSSHVLSQHAVGPLLGPQCLCLVDQLL
jgi:hypothetical protein